MKDVSEFINEIKNQVTLKDSPYHPKKVHYMGSTILTNLELKAMLNVYYDWWAELPSNEKRKIADYIFDELRALIE